MEGTGGIRKVRFALENRGKSGSVRVCYTDFAEYEVTFRYILFSSCSGRRVDHFITGAAISRDGEGTNAGYIQASGNRIDQNCAHEIICRSNAPTNDCGISDGLCRAATQEFAVLPMVQRSITSP